MALNFTNDDSIALYGIVGLALMRHLVVPLGLPVRASLFMAHTALLVPYANQLQALTGNRSAVFIVSAAANVVVVALLLPECSSALNDPLFSLFFPVKFC